MSILVTGSAGFIGFHTSFKLIKKNNVIGVDNFDDYYDVNLKKDRIKELKKSKYNKNYIFIKLDLTNFNSLKLLFNKYKITKIIHLAAQAGVRHSLKKPRDYVDNNIIATFNLLELSKTHNIKHFVFASTSSVYGNQVRMPFKESTSASHPIQFYAATKRSCELMCHSYSHLYRIPITVLRFFTVYGPWGRPDMALFNFTKRILENKKINVFNFGNHLRDFTYVQDVVDGVLKILNKKPGTVKINKIKDDPSISDAPYKIYNIGGGKPVKLMSYIREIEINLSRKAKINFMTLQKGDIKSTYCSTKKLNKEINYIPKTPIKIV